MTRVSQEHLDARRRQILDAARRCFVRNGFHATSMQDVLVEAGLSAGAVYRYFKGKDAIISAIVSETLTDVATSFAAEEDAPPPDLDDIVEIVLRVDAPVLSKSEESARLLVQVWSEALRSPELGAQLKDIMDEARQVVAGLVRRHQERGALPRDVPAEHMAAVLVALVDGFMVQWAVDGRADPAAFRSGLRALMSAGSRPEN
ncbi:transcriptional regulator, TetR family [Glycomyces sambucus]|uniref:Transcriptional regulator, TetR family n=1 Tax=Glycomyces sambucus TaxID=380244 RepID=A0A1G9H5A6_9ACTN|nr:TetR/AcrR family transcriptional regulator [Glycomyces sambucus]SDL08090.1 transcriptional regulator, TetR family [Glycomyces sambucus]